MDYQEFVENKRVLERAAGLAEIPQLNQSLFPFQKDVVEWALKRGRAAIFSDCGTGKTPMQLEWARHVPGQVLILAPLAVAAQTLREGAKFGIEVRHARSQAEVTGQITITNYEMMEHFDASKFAGIVLDESSILKSYMGKTKMAIIRSFRDTPFKLACTATPAPNDHMELGNHADFLNVMPSNEMLARWFCNDTMHAGVYKLKKHGERDFWQWVASWAVAMRRPSDIGDYSDDGYILPKLTIKTNTIAVSPADGWLFNVGGALSATEIHRVKRTSAEIRAKEVAAFVAQSHDQCLVWCDTDYEADAIVKAIPDAVEVRGSDKETKKETALVGFADGEFKTLITKPSIAGYGMNFQNCHRCAFVGLSYSFENLYQAIRRVYRFGQANEVECLIVETDAECGINDVVTRKIQDHERMQTEMCNHMKEFQTMKNKQLAGLPQLKNEESETWKLYNGDCVQTCGLIADGTIDFSVFSPPFANLYIYSDSMADMGNCANSGEFFAQMKFLIRELLRVTANGRLCAVHCKDLPAYKGRDGAAGLVDFPGEIIRNFGECGWQYHSRVTIWKDPVTEMQRTKNHGLLHKQLCKDSSASRQGMADYLIVFRKWAGDEFDRPVHGPSKDVRFDSYIGEDGPESVRSARDMSIQVWQRYASPVWFDIRQQRVLQGSRNATSEEDEKHICPLQLDVIERAIHLWTNENDLVFSPFAGIGSEGYCAVRMGRRFVGAELKESYWRMALQNLKAAETEAKQDRLL
jgi:superfamily II DNA or RNA helicase